MSSSSVSLDISSLDKAIAQLETSLRYAGSAMAQQDAELALQFRAASIQAFAFTYELSHKLLKRYLEATDLNPASVDAWTFQELIRTGAERGLLQSSWDVWVLYRKARGTTNHTYSDAYAAEVFALIPAFLQEAQFLQAQLHQRLRCIF
jgi:nucleotidyltransferase substrate binding protein (TIGR01987 family)